MEVAESEDLMLCPRKQNVNLRERPDEDPGAAHPLLHLVLRHAQSLAEQFDTQRKAEMPNVGALAVCARKDDQLERHDHN